MNFNIKQKNEGDEVKYDTVAIKPQMAVAFEGIE